MNLESEQRNSTLDKLKQQTSLPPSLMEQQTNILYTMPKQTLERLENILQRTLALQEHIRGETASLATLKSLEPLATSELLAKWLNQTAELNQELYRSIRQQCEQDGKKHEEFIRELSGMEETFRRNWDGRLQKLEKSSFRIILSSAGISMLISILLWTLLK